MVGRVVKKCEFFDDMIYERLWDDFTVRMNFAIYIFTFHEGRKCVHKFAHVTLEL